MPASSQGSLQQVAVTRGIGFTHFANTPGLPLSLKTIVNGRAHYRVERKEVMIDDGGYLIVNDGQPYSIEIASPTRVETFILWFPSGWAEEVNRSLTSSSRELLAEPNARAARCEFFPTYTRHDDRVSPRARELRDAHASGAKLDDAWLEERMRSLLAAMLGQQDNISVASAKLAAARPATREELWRRLSRGRDYLHARCSASVSLSEAAGVACLSPFHFLRTFRAAFDCTPHEYLSRCRVERAKFLLERTELPLAEIALDSGFATPSSFSSTFRNLTGSSPREWRTKNARRLPQNSKIRKVFLAGRV